MTRCQYNVYKVVKEFIEKNGYSPSVREICDILGYSSPATAETHLQKLKDKGYITFIEKRSRTIRIIKEFKCNYKMGD